MHDHCPRFLQAFLTAVLLTTAVAAQDSQHPLAAIDTTSPRGTLSGFLEEMHEVHLVFEQKGRSASPTAEVVAARMHLLRCLDLRELPPAVRVSLGKEAAVCLKEVLDRIELPPIEDWPGPDDVLDRGVRRWTIPHTEITLEALGDGPREGEFVFSSETVERATSFYDTVSGLPYWERETVTPGLYRKFVSEPGWMIPRDWIPAWSHQRWFGQAIWQWVGLIITLVAAVLIMVAIYVTGRRRSRTVQRNITRYLFTLAFPIAALLVPLATRYFIVEQLQVYGYLIVAITVGLHLVFLLALMILVVSVGSRLAELIVASPWIKAGLDAELVRLVCRLLSIVGAAVVLLEGGQSLGFSLTTLLAGAGVSGLALALAAQDSLRNLLGSMMIMLDKPFRVGERVVAQGHDGVVEEIGLRSTKLRLLSGHQVSIPNEEMARADIDNIGRRPFIRQSATIELPADTPTVKIRRALAILRGLLEDHEGMKPELPPRVHLRDVNERSIGIAVVYWYHPPEYWQFLAFSERITLEMAESFEAEGILYAAPVLSVRLPPDSQAGRTLEQG